MKRWCLIILACFLFMGNAYGYGAYSPLITKIENSFYGIDYAEQTDIKRLERLEETVYGEVQQGDLKTRMNKLSKDISADLIGKEIKPKADTFMDDEPTYMQEKTPVADNSANYPVVDTMEDIIFKKTYKNNDIKNRITNLEKEVFKQVYPSEDLYNRVERLKSSVLIEENPQMASYNDIVNNQNQYQGDDIYQSDYPNQDDYNSYTPSYPRKQSENNSYQTSSTDLTVPIGALEQSILKKNYPNDNIDNRISRMENKLFSTQFNEDDAPTRINRLGSAYNAQKSSKKYDNNKFSQNMSTIVQIGMTVLMILAMVL